MFARRDDFSRIGNARWRASFVQFHGRTVWKMTEACRA